MEIDIGFIKSNYQEDIGEKTSHMIVRPQERNHIILIRPFSLFLINIWGVPQIVSLLLG